MPKLEPLLYSPSKILLHIWDGPGGVMIYESEAYSAKMGAPPKSIYCTVAMGEHYFEYGPMPAEIGRQLVERLRGTQGSEEGCIEEQVERAWKSSWVAAVIGEPRVLPYIRKDPTGCATICMDRSYAKLMAGYHLRQSVVAKDQLISRLAKAKSDDDIRAVFAQARDLAAEEMCLYVAYAQAALTEEQQP